MKRAVVAIKDVSRLYVGSTFFIGIAAFARKNVIRFAVSDMFMNADGRTFENGDFSVHMDDVFPLLFGKKGKDMNFSFSAGCVFAYDGIHRNLLVEFLLLYAFFDHLIGFYKNFLIKGENEGKMEDIFFKRRSIRLFEDKEIPEEILHYILRAGLWAPSPKNRQPWKFIVVTGGAKKEMIAAMERGIARSEAGEGIITGSREYLSNAKYTMKSMEAAAVTVFIMNPGGKDPRDNWTAAEKIHEMSDIQSIGGAAENMALAASVKGVGSLWIGNIFFAYDELKKWLGDGEPVLAMSFGYPLYNPRPLPRKEEKEVLEIRR